MIFVKQDDLYSGSMLQEKANLYQIQGYHKVVYNKNGCTVLQAQGRYIVATLL